MIKATAAVDPPIIENIPEQLTERPQWVCWRREIRGGKTTKVPYTPAGGRASTTDLMTWRTFEDAMNGMRGADALEALGIAPYHGVGFVFSSADPFVGIDIDDCRNPETGEIAPGAQKIIDRVQEGYVEISPSGTGIHIIVQGAVRDGGMRKGKVEMYSRGRFFTITGETL